MLQPQLPISACSLFGVSAVCTCIAYAYAYAAIIDEQTAHIFSGCTYDCSVCFFHGPDCIVAEWELSIDKSLSAYQPAFIGKFLA